MHKDIYKNDIENRFPGCTVEETRDGERFTAQFKDGEGKPGDRSRAGNAGDAMFQLRKNLVGDLDILPLQTNSQKNALTNVMRSQKIVVEGSNGVDRLEYYGRSGWIILPNHIEL